MVQTQPRAEISEQTILDCVAAPKIGDDMRNGAKAGADAQPIIRRCDGVQIGERPRKFDTWRGPPCHLRLDAASALLTGQHIDVRQDCICRRTLVRVSLKSVTMPVRPPSERANFTPPS